MAAVENMQVTDNVVGFMADKLRNLQSEPLELIKIAACIGNRFDMKTITTVSQGQLDAILNTIDVLVEEGLITYRNKLYHFNHDRIHEAAYSLLGLKEKESLHYHIGRLTLEKTTAAALSYKVFYIADQLNHAHDLLHNRKERLRLTDINLRAGIKAKDATAYDAAVVYLGAGMKLLSEDAWQTDYRLTYTLYMELVQCQYLARNFDEAERLFQSIVANASGKVDKAGAYSTMIVLYTNTRPPEDALALGITALRFFGIKLSRNIGLEKVLRQLLKVKLKLRKISMDDILTLPTMADEERKAYHTVLFNMGTPAYFVNPKIYAFIVLLSINESFRFGLPPHAAITFMTLASILENVLGDYELGYKMGKMAIKLNHRLGNRKLDGMVHHIFAYLIQHWNRHAKNDLRVYRKVYRLCLDHGNFIYAGHSVNAVVDCRLMIGEQLDITLRDNSKYQKFIDQVKDPFIAGHYAENNQVIRSLIGLNPDPVSLSGPGFDDEAYLAKLRAEKHTYGLCFSLLHKVRLFYLFGRYEDARKSAEEANRYIQAPMGSLIVSEYYFYYSLTLAALLGLPETQKKMRIRWTIRKNLRKLAKWAAICPENFRHKYDLVMAEMAAADSRKSRTLDYYHAAVKGAREHEYINEEGLACERLALFYHHRFDALEEALAYMRRAHQCYGFWGARAKQRHLEAHYAFLLPEKLKRQANQSDNHMTIPRQATSKQLDFETVMQVSQAISSEIMIDQLLDKTMGISIANAGAQRGFLILVNDEDLMIEAYEDSDRDKPEIRLPIPLEECRELCQAIVHFVFRSREAVILDNAAAEGPFVNDHYIIANQCKSILCMPILSKGILSGILYMENSLTAKVFTSDRLEILGIIAAQTAISLENARLFELATVDGLTKLFVHRYFHFLLQQEIDRSRRYERPITLVMIDIDDFKQCNDTYGHQAGDEVLKQVSRLLRSNIRTVDIAARYGGEEFALILPETDLSQALMVSEKIRELIHNLSIVCGEQTLAVTISLGLATFPYHSSDRDSLIRSADAALYVSKRAGKNRVSVGEKQNPVEGSGGKGGPSMEAASP